MTDRAVQPAATSSGPGARDVFVARQPIMTEQSSVLGYELLYRSARDPLLVEQNPKAATGHVLAAALFSIGLERLVGNARAWINLPREWLIEEIVGLLPTTRVVLEVLESVAIDDEVMGHCRSLKSQGFTLALDGYVPNDPRYPLLTAVEYVKVDLGAVDESELPKLVHLIRAAQATPVAKRVEDWFHLERALEYGFELFQGYYLMRPDLVSGRQVPVLDSTRLMALKVAADEGSTLEDVEQIVSTDAGLAFRLLRYLNAAAFGFREPVATVHQAVVRLGDRAARTWLLLATIRAIGKGRPLELIAISAIRGRMCERLAHVSGRDPRREEAFMAGLFLNIDAITGMTMSDVLEAVSLPDTVAAALTGQPAGDVGDVLELAVAYESGMWDRVEELATTLGISPDIASQEYFAAIEWARGALSV